jgi:hypothetical protein
LSASYYVSRRRKPLWRLSQLGGRFFDSVDWVKKFGRDRIHKSGSASLASAAGLDNKHHGRSMERAAVSNLISRDEFVRVATEFKARLAATNSFEEMLVLWRSTSIAYSYDALDPFSPEYRGAVLDVYQKLTQIAYDEQSELTSTKQSD